MAEPPAEPTIPSAAEPAEPGSGLADELTAAEYPQELGGFLLGAGWI